MATLQGLKERLLETMCRLGGKKLRSVDIDYKYFVLTGVLTPFRKYGFKSLDELLKEMPDVVVKKDGNAMLFSLSPASNAALSIKSEPEPIEEVEETDKNSKKKNNPETVKKSARDAVIKEEDEEPTTVRKKTSDVKPEPQDDEGEQQGETIGTKPAAVRDDSSDEEKAFVLGRKMNPATAVDVKFEQLEMPAAEKTTEIKSATEGRGETKLAKLPKKQPKIQTIDDEVSQQTKKTVKKEPQDSESIEEANEEELKKEEEPVMTATVKKNMAKTKNKARKGKKPPEEVKTQRKEEDVGAEKDAQEAEKMVHKLKIDAPVNEPSKNQKPIVKTEKRKKPPKAMELLSKEAIKAAKEAQKTETFLSQVQCLLEMRGGQGTLKDLRIPFKRMFTKDFGREQDRCLGSRSVDRINALMKGQTTIDASTRHPSLQICRYFEENTKVPARFELILRSLGGVAGLKEMNDVCRTLYEDDIVVPSDEELEDMGVRVEIDEDDDKRHSYRLRRRDPNIDSGVNRIRAILEEFGGRATQEEVELQYMENYKKTLDFYELWRAFQVRSIVHLERLSCGEIVVEEMKSKEGRCERVFYLKKRRDEDEREREEDRKKRNFKSMAKKFARLLLDAAAPMTFDEIIGEYNRRYNLDLDHANREHLTGIGKTRAFCDAIGNTGKIMLFLSSDGKPIMALPEQYQSGKCDGLGEPVDSLVDAHRLWRTEREQEQTVKRTEKERTVGEEDELNGVTRRKRIAEEDTDSEVAKKKARKNEDREDEDVEEMISEKRTLEEFHERKEEKLFAKKQRSMETVVETKKAEKKPLTCSRRIEQTQEWSTPSERSAAGPLKPTKPPKNIQEALNLVAAPSPEKRVLKKWRKRAVPLVTIFSSDDDDDEKKKKPEEKTTENGSKTSVIEEIGSRRSNDSSEEEGEKQTSTGPQETKTDAKIMKKRGSTVAVTRTEYEDLGKTIASRLQQAEELGVDVVAVKQIISTVLAFIPSS